MIRESIPGNGYDLRTVTLDGEGTSETLLATEFDELNATLSRDGRWLAYQSDASGQTEVYVRPFPNIEAGLWPASSDGGSVPLWAPSGNELYYLGATSLMAVPLRTDPSFVAGTPEPLFDVNYYTDSIGRTYDITPDGERFLMITRTGVDQGLGAPSMTVVLNWHLELLERVPIP